MQLGAKFLRNLFKTFENVWDFHIHVEKENLRDFISCKLKVISSEKTYGRKTLIINFNLKAD